MSKDPAVLLYTSDFLSGVSFFTMEDRGKYITLLCEQHQKGSIPEFHLLRVCGSKESPVYSKFIKDIDGSFYNERMRKESIKRKSFCESRKNGAYALAHALHKPVLMDNENRNRIINDIKIKI
jgi:hypothetical protein